MTLFFLQDINHGILNLSEDDSLHCAKALRLRTDDIIHVTDGNGNLAKCSILSVHPKHTEVRVLSMELQQKPRSYHLHIGIAPTKNIGRFEWFLEKATELGVDEITPLSCEHSERVSVRKERLEKILVAAMKQSLGTFLPRLHELTPLDKFLKQDHKGRRFIAYCREEMTVLLSGAYKQNEDALILIGPEGDFSLMEVKSSIRHGFKAISLGKSRLRTETAGIAAVHTIHLVNEL